MLISLCLGGCSSLDECKCDSNCLCLDNYDSKEMSKFDNLSQKKYLEIQLSYKEIYGKPANLKYFLGMYSEAYVFMRDAGSRGDEETMVEVAGFIFIMPDRKIRCNVYYEGDFYNLKQAYDNGLLNNQNIEDIYSKWQELILELE